MMTDVTRKLFMHDSSHRDDTERWRSCHSKRKLGPHCDHSMATPCETAEDQRTVMPSRDEQITSTSEGGSANVGHTTAGCNNLEKSQDDPQGDDASGPEVEGVAICQFFMLGKCHFGKRCRLSHSLSHSPSDIPEGTDREHVGGPDMDQDGKNKMKVRKKKMQKRGNRIKEVEVKEPTKKPRMRTADDVISRILWDPSLDPTDFSVGYLDRFLGVLERPFSEFSWDTDVCSCDYSEELALPRHRIKYFTYRGQRVWDRESRMDGVFGSTGAPLESPFAAGSKKVEGNITQEPRPHELVEEQWKTPHKETNEVCAVDACDQHSFHVCHGEDEEKASGDRLFSLAEVAAGDMQDNQKGIPSNATQGQQQAGSETDMGEKEVADDPGLSKLTARVSLSERGNTDREQEEWKESWEDEQEKEGLSWQPWPSSQHSSHSFENTESPAATMEVQAEALEQRQNPSRRKPTHFITFRADTPQFLSGFQHLLDEVTSHLPLSAPHWASPESLHVTLCLLVLSGPKEVSEACQILREFARKHGQQPLSLTIPPNLGHFEGRVLFLTPQPLSRIQSLNRPLQEAYKEKGWLHSHSKSPRYHLTLAKVEAKGGERVFEKVGGVFNGAEKLRAIKFGRLDVNKLYLCVVNAAMREDGFYETVCVVNLQ
ncbi:hypothetical protein AGOR_G00208120 [Albula goreensis]|uniref:C3H1-type domain-containing protein n=1 Tax=Albula goreensis TaxID=1534307 RepID=A0A8T3CQ08_9TELE|nr:hypothetical protein AGOR_G00208120 [Albula goreensis]